MATRWSIVTLGALLIGGGAARVVLISIGAENCPSPELFEAEIRNL